MTMVVMFKMMVSPSSSVVVDFPLDVDTDDFGSFAVSSSRPTSCCGGSVTCTGRVVVIDGAARNEDGV